tara:strand:- start:316 stop:783 length:468 start_codon:yes stop_codon:yes gene_type:complete
MRKKTPPLPENLKIETPKKVKKKKNNKVKEQVFRIDTNKLINNEYSIISVSLLLKVADEIVRMEKNLNLIPDETEGKRQLERSLERVRDTIILEGYEIVDMLGKNYHEGDNLKAVFVEDKKLAKGESKITRIIKPQINFKGKLIQSAEVEVSIRK